MDPLKFPPKGELEERIRARAYELWQQRGETTTAKDNWLEAERQVLDEANRAFQAAAGR
jgi:hypothetical protein